MTEKQIRLPLDLGRPLRRRALTPSRTRLTIVLSVVLAAAVAAAVAMGAAAARVAAGGPYRNGLVLFTRCCGTPGTGIYVVNPNGSGQRLVYRAKFDDAPLTPSWSPDGKRIAFTPGVPLGGVWTMRANGTAPTRVTAGRGEALFPSWSPAGKWIAFADRQSASSGLHDIFRVKLDGTGLKRLTHAVSEETSPAWAPNGATIVYDRGRDLWRMKPDGMDQLPLIRNARHASWSPGGSTIAFVRGGDPWLAARDGSKQRRVVHLAQAIVFVTWSPDSRWLVVAPMDRGDLTLLRPDGSAAQPLTHEPDYFHGSPNWQRLPG